MEFDSQAWALGSAGLLYFVAFSLTLLATWAPFAWKTKERRQKLAIIFNSGAITAATAASVLWIALDSKAPAFLTWPFTPFLIVTVGGISLITAGIRKDLE